MNPLKLQLNGTGKGIYLTLVVLYVGLAYLFSSFSPQAQVVSLWPPAGVALAGCLMFGGRFLPAIFLGSTIFNVGTQIGQTGDLQASMVLLSTVIAVGSTIQAWVNYKVLRYRGLNILVAPSYSQAATFIFVALVCCFISAFIGNTALTISQNETIYSLLHWNNVLVWWVGDFLGVILVAPILLSLLHKNPSKVSRAGLVKGLAVPLALIVVVFQVAQQYIEDVIIVNTKNEFVLKAQVAENSLKRQVDAYLDSLDQLEAELSRRESISKEEFARIVERLTADLPGIKAMSWNPLVLQEDIPAFERYSRTHVDPDFQIKGEPLQPTDPLVVVQLIEPLEENRAAQGFNVFSNATRKQSMLHSKNSLMATATSIIQLVQSDKKEPGFLIFTPVFKSVEPSSSSMSGYQSLRGFAVGVFLVSEIIQQGFSDDLISFIDIYIYENGDPADKVYGNDNIVGAQSVGDGLGHVFEMKFADHQWTFNLHIDRDVVLGLQIGDSLNFLIAQMIFGIFSVFIILSAYGRHEQLQQQVNARTKELKAVNTELEHYAFYDSLTGLPNRRLFIDRVQHATSLAKRSHKRVALLFMDLNRFKQVNDSLGHECGDQLLIEVAHRFSDTLRGSDTLARVGGDEFTLLIENDPSNETIIAVAQKLSGCLRQPIELSGKSLITSTSIGVAVFPQDGDSFADLLRGADTAMYQAKHSSEEVCFYSENLHKKVNQQLFLETELPRVLEKGQLELYYQPIMQLGTQRHIGCECLLRWNHPTQGLISPANFIPAAEVSGEIVPIGYWVIEQSCQTLARWLKNDLIIDKMSVNVSARQLQHEHFFETVKGIIQRCGIRPELLQFEVTESTLMQNVTLAVEALQQLKTLGITIAIDDYGTGYSSLSYLKQMPVDVLKIDQSFIQGMQQGDHDYAIVKSTAYMAAELGITVIAEGVETEAQLDLLQTIKCEMYQGNFYSEPLQESDYLTFTHRNQSEPVAQLIRD